MPPLGPVFPAIIIVGTIKVTLRAGSVQEVPL
jgi:hypothetical protein